MILTALLLATAPALGQADPFAPARAGKIQCVVPNREKKTCAGTTRYVFTGNDYVSTTWLFLAPSPLITMQMHTRGTVTDGRLCETVKLADFQAGAVMVDGKPADDATSDAVKGQLNAALASLDGKAACSTFVPAADGTILNQVTIDGAIRSDLSQPFIWVSEQDGYTLGM